MSYEKLGDGSVAQWIDRLRSCTTLASGKNIHAELGRSHNQLQSDTYLSNLLVQMYGRCSSVEDARRVFDSIQRKDVFSWNLLLYANVQNGLLDEAKQVFASIPCKDAVSWNTILTALVKLERIEEAKEVYDQMQAPQRDPVTYNVMIGGYAQAGRTVVSPSIPTVMCGDDSFIRMLLDNYNQA